MSMKIIKPMTLGILHKPYTWKKSHYLSIAALGFFRLGESQHRFLTENTQWPLVMKSLPKGQPLDAAMPKAHCEILMAGSACAPAGQTLQKMDVSIEVGRMAKCLRIYGDRQWLYGLIPLYQITAPKPFTVMPIAYDRAYGGQNYAYNPTGQGYTGQRFAALIGQNQGHMPNIEYPHEPVKNNSSQYMPAGFGPLDLRWPQRVAKAGTYDQKWMDNDFPGLPSDIDFSTFNSAPCDQWLEDNLKGGEAYRLCGMSPKQPVIEGRLPEYKTKAFVLKHKQAIEDAEEVDLTPETIWFFPEHQLGVLIYRGQCVVEDSDALDVASITLAYESMKEKDKPIAHYHEVIEKRSNLATAMHHVFNESQLAPALNEEEKEKKKLLKQERNKSLQDQRQANAEEMLRDAWEKQGKTSHTYQAPEMPKPMFDSLTEEEIASGDFDLSVIAEQGDAIIKQQKAEAKAREVDLDKQRKEALSQIPDKPIKPVEKKQKEQEEDVLTKAGKPAIDLVGGDIRQDDDVNTLLNALDQQEIGGHDVSEERKKIHEQAPIIMAMKRKARHSKTNIDIDKKPLMPAVASKLGQQILKWVKEGISLVGRDLAGADLSGADLRGVDFTEALMEYVNFQGCNLALANLSSATLLGANLEEANLTGCNLEQVNLCHTNLKKAKLVKVHAVKAFINSSDMSKADFSESNLTQSMIIESQMDDAIFNDSVINQANFIKSQGRNTCWHKVQASMPNFTQANLPYADFSGARLDRVVFLGAQLAHAIFKNSDMERVQIDRNGCLDGADFRFSTATHCGFRGCSMKEANLSRSRLAQCDFGLADLSDANLSEGVFYRSLFMQTTLERANLTKADFFQALCRKVNMTDADVRGANLVQAEMTEAILINTRFDSKQKKQRRAA